VGEVQARLAARRPSGPGPASAGRARED
jgi:hypothetical protein